MSYRIDPGEPLGIAVRRIVGEQLQNAVDQLEGRGDPDREAAVHDARKSLKKARSALRLVRDDLDEAVRAQEGGVLRDAGRSLSGVRDAEVLLKTLGTLEAGAGGELSPDAVGPLRSALERRRDELVAAAHGSGGAASDAARDLREAERRIPSWPLPDEAPQAIRRGLVRIHERGALAMARAFRKKAEDEDWHEWRKRVKDLWYSLRILEPLSPRMLSGMVEEASELSDVLGDHNDLAVLTEAIDRHAEELPDGAAAALHAAARARRVQLRASARRHGAVLYAEDPEALGRRVRAYARATSV